MDRDTDHLSPLRPAHDTGNFAVWRLVQSHAGESCRWETLDGRWITVSLGQGDDIGSIVVADSDGQRRLVESYEGALELAKEWRL